MSGTCLGLLTLVQNNKFCYHYNKLLLKEIVSCYIRKVNLNRNLIKSKLQGFLQHKFITFPFSHLHY